MSTRDFHFEIVVVGAGPAGLAAACAADECGKQVALIDESPWLGGQIWRGQQAQPTVPQARKLLDRVRASNITVLDRTNVFASPAPGVLAAEHPEGTRMIHAEKIILATGARELFLPFPGWTLPGVTGAGGLQSLAKNGWPVKDKRVVIAGSGPLLLAVADGLKKAGARIVSLNEQTDLQSAINFGVTLLKHPEKIRQGIGIKLRLAGVPHLHHTWPVRAEGDGKLERVVLTNGHRTWTEECDLLACGFGLVPNVELPLALGCALTGGFVKVNRWQGTNVEDIFCAGEPTGIGGVDCALIEGRIAGYAASGKEARAMELLSRRDDWHDFREQLANAFALRPELKSLASDDTLVCRCEDVSLGKMKAHASWRSAKLHTRCGMGPCQGRVCGAAARELFGWDTGGVRPPVSPVKVASLMECGQHRPL